MKSRALGLALCLTCFTSVAPSAFAGDATVKTIANILSHLNHFPGDAEKQSLAAIAKDASATAGEKVVAQALLNFSHMASESDEKALEKVAADNNEPAHVRELARIVSHTHHMVSPEDQEKLKGMM